MNTNGENPLSFQEDASFIRSFSDIIASSKSTPPNETDTSSYDSKQFSGLTDYNEFNKKNSMSKKFYMSKIYAEDESSRLLNQVNLDCSNYSDAIPSTSYQNHHDNLLDCTSDNSISSNKTIVGSTYSNRTDNQYIANGSKYTGQLTDSSNDYSSSYTYHDSSSIGKMESKLIRTLEFLPPPEQGVRFNNVVDCCTDTRKCYYITDDILKNSPSIDMNEHKTTSEKSYYMSNKIDPKDDDMIKKNTIEAPENVENINNETNYLAYYMEKIIQNNNSFTNEDEQIVCTCNNCAENNNFPIENNYYFSDEKHSKTDDPLLGVTLESLNMVPQSQKDISEPSQVNSEIYQYTCTKLIVEVPGELLYRNDKYDSQLEYSTNLQVTSSANLDINSSVDKIIGSDEFRLTSVSECAMSMVYSDIDLSQNLSNINLVSNIYYNEGFQNDSNSNQSTFNSNPVIKLYNAENYQHESQASVNQHCNLEQEEEDYIMINVQLNFESYADEDKKIIDDSRLLSKVFNIRKSNSKVINFYGDRSSANSRIVLTYYVHEIANYIKDKNTKIEDNDKYKPDLYNAKVTVKHIKADYNSLSKHQYSKYCSFDDFLCVGLTIHKNEKPFKRIPVNVACKNRFRIVRQENRAKNKSTPKNKRDLKTKSLFSNTSEHPDTNRNLLQNVEDINIELKPNISVVQIQGDSTPSSKNNRLELENIVSKDQTDERQYSNKGKSREKCHRSQSGRNHSDRQSAFNARCKTANPTMSLLKSLFHKPNVAGDGSKSANVIKRKKVTFFRFISFISMT